MRGGSAGILGRALVPFRQPFYKNVLAMSCSAPRSCYRTGLLTHNATKSGHQSFPPHSRSGQLLQAWSAACDQVSTVPRKGPKDC